MLFEDPITYFIDESFRSFSAEYSLADALIGLFWSLMLCAVIAITYRGTHRGVSYSQNFTQTLVLLGLIVTTVMIVVGTNIARAFTLVGALSIVRFRNAVKETRDVGFIFFVMVIAMACGTRFYSLAIISTIAGCFLIFIMTFTDFGKKGFAQDILEMNIPTTLDYPKLLTPIMRRYLKYYSLLGVDSVDDTTNRLSFIITFKKKSAVVSVMKKRREEITDELSYKSALIGDIQKIKEIKNIKLIEGSSSVEI